MNITLSIDEQTLVEARKVAAAMGKSLNQMIRDELERLIGAQRQQAEWAELVALSGQGNAKGWVFDRDELHERT